MQSFDDLIVDVEGDRVTFCCAFCGREITTKIKTFEKKPLCMSCILRTSDIVSAEESIYFLEDEYSSAEKAFSADELKLLETKETFRPSMKSLCSCSCGKTHKVLFADLSKKNYRGCPKKRTRKGQNSSKEDKIRKLFTSRGCEYIGPYENNKTPTKYICSCGKEAEVRVHAITKAWKGCRECSYKKRAEFLRK
ncbi:hypothetical protein MarSH_352 [Marseillevirus Shanghai 1]|uniref:hypothetical protein n=1 Tax=Melbournevirus TaxID=1560514 RepID=UPI00051F53AC|nr:hypothetical protein MEL_306 [Melbournevirus]AIT54919.1 hypothetical protein MEL_306 [Melbournevirus]AVR53057.1 hypothetical protein MarSH_352 [Marseillevirus Shanghai 1]